MVGLRVVVWLALWLAGLAAAAACGGSGQAGKAGKAGQAGKPATPAAGQPQARAAPRLIATVDLAQGRKLAVHAAAIHDGTPCWTFVTRGMAAKGHPELVLSITMRKGDAAERYPADAVELLRSLAAALPEHTRLDPWLSLSASVGALGRADLVGMAAVPAEGPAGVELPDGAVTLLMLTAEETEVARDHGAARIAAMLGRHYRFYPTAWWFDRDRPSLLTRAQLATTGLAGMKGVRVAGLTTVLQTPAAPVVKKAADERGLPQADTSLTGATLHVRVARETAPAFIRTLRELDPGESALGLLQPDPLAGGRFVWVPGEAAPQVITGPDFTGRVTGSFLGLALEKRGAKAKATLVEDGAILLLTPAERDAIAAALDKGRPHRAPATADSMAWTVELVSQDVPGPRTVTDVTFLTGAEQLRQHVWMGDVIELLQLVEREVIAAARGKQPAAATARVHLTLRPKGRAVRIETTPEDRGAWVDDLRRRIERLPAVPVTGEVALHATFSMAVAAGPR